MKQLPQNQIPMTTVALSFADGRQVEFDIQEDFTHQIQAAAQKIRLAYKTLKDQDGSPDPNQPFEAEIVQVQKKAHPLLPDLDRDERFNVLYLYMTFWLSFATHPETEIPPSQSLEIGSWQTENGPNPPTFGGETTTENLTSFVAHALAWIIVYERHQRHGTLLKSLPPKRAPGRKKVFVPNAFPHGIAVVPNNPVVATGLRAIFKGGPQARKLLGGWRQIGEQVFYRQIHRSGRGEIRYYPYLPQNGTRMQLNVESLWDYVESLNPFTADVALAILAQLCEPSVGGKPKFPLRQSVLITAEAIMRYKGIQRYGKDRRIMEKRIHAEVERLRTLYFDMERYPLPWDRKGTHYQGDRLFDIVRVETYQLQLFDKEEIIETAWSVRAGQWAEHFFNTEQQRVWTSRMAKALMEMDHRNQRKAAQLAKKIGYLLLTVPGGTAHRNFPITRRLDLMLEEMGELPAPEYRTKDWAGRLRDNLMNAWGVLLKAGLIKDLRFPDGYGFDDTDRTKGWVENWLVSRIILTTPEAAPEPTQNELNAFHRQYRRKTQRRISKKIRKTPQPLQLQVCNAVYRKKIRNACEERYISQRTLARILGIAPSTLSNILRGHDLPSPNLAQKIATWLENGESV